MPGATTNSLRARLKRFAAATAGGIAIWTAVAMPPLAVLAVGAVELASIGSDRQELQDAADAAALAGAQELGFAGPGGVTQRAQAYALSQAADVARRQTITATASLRDQNRAVRVELRANRMSFFGNLLPPGGFNTAVASIASLLASQPLCVVGMQTTSGNNIHLYDAGRIQSPGCLVQSNRDVQVDSVARINAGEVQVAGTVSGGGRITPSALVGAPPLADPFADRTINFPPCNTSEILGTVDGVRERRLKPRSLDGPRSHCGNLYIKDNATLWLDPGVHYFRNADIQMESRSRLRGDGVVLIFDNQSSLNIKGRSIVDLRGMGSGEWAGFVIVGARRGGEDFHFESDEINRLEGVIYLPSSLMTVFGAQQIAEQSNWTVTLAERIEVRGSTALVINANYRASIVPVPDGVGPRDSGTRLSR